MKGVIFNVVFRKSILLVYNECDMFFVGGFFVFRGFWLFIDSIVFDLLNMFGFLIVKIGFQLCGGKVFFISIDFRDVLSINFYLFEEGDVGMVMDLVVELDIVKFVRRLFVFVLVFFGLIFFVELLCFGGMLVDGICDDVVDIEWFKNQIFGYYLISICVIGVDFDFNVVLDSKFRVRGVCGLRVVDVSVFFRVLGLFLVLFIFMFSEKVFESVLVDVYIW